MNKEIQYSGYSAVPSDYEAADGSLAAAINLIPDNGAVRPLPTPTQIINMFLPEYKLIYIHKTASYTHYVVYHPQAKCLFWVDSKEIINGGMPLNKHQLMKIYLGFDLYDITSVGNALLVASNMGMSYCVWDEAGYKELSGNPFLSLEFGLHTVAHESLLQSIDVETPANRDNPEGLKITAENVTNALYGHILDSESEFKKNGYFLMPFFVRYAFKLYDGSYIWQSAPVLLFPTAAPPKVLYNSDYSTLSHSEISKFGFTYLMSLSQLAFRIVDGSEVNFKEWESIITSVDVFVSPPIYTWDQASRLPTAIYTTWGNLLSKLYRKPVNDNDNSSDDESGGGGTGNPGRPTTWASVRPGGNVRPGYNGNGVNNSGFSIPTCTDLFIGHHGNCYGNNGFHDVIGDKNDSTKVYNIPRNENFHKQVVSNARFYKVASIPFHELSFSDDFKILMLDDANLTNLLTRKELPDDYQSHCKVYGKTLHAYNNRVGIGCVELTPPIPYPFRSFSPAVFDKPESDAMIGVHVRVWLKKDGIIYTVDSPYHFDGASQTDFKEPYRIESTKDHFPRWIFYPDSSAYKMMIEFTNGESYTIPLTPHDFLNGAYYYGSFDVDPRPPADPEDLVLDDTEQNAAEIIPRHNAIYTSEVNNPFYFPLLGINTVGTGTILGLSTAAKALSEGQFGQFPLYAFTSEGVWAMEVSPTGTYSAKQPITRDVCINPAGITQIDSAVLFPTDRGIMLISGSQTQCISDSINSDTPFSVLDLPGIQKLHAAMGHELDSCIPAIPFSQFLRSCRMIYDYVHQHIIVYNPAVRYAYVYSLRSQQWGMMHSDITDSLNSYPEALAVDRFGHVVDFSQSDPDAQLPPQLLVTRPLKLDAPDILKTVNNVIQRGHFRKGHVRSVLYGSRDLFSWHLVWSSKDHYLRGFSGSPYKYFRIALLCNLSADESIFGASVQFNPRQTNQPR